MTLGDQLEFVEQLKQVLWSPRQEFSTLFKSHKISHGFCGVGVPHPRDVFSLKQIHSTTLYEVASLSSQTEVLNIEGDGLWSRKPDTAVAVRTADCLPVLFATKSGAFVAAVHAGWRGLTAGILIGLVDEVPLAAKADLLACIGPAIGLGAFEVGPEVIDALIKSGTDQPDSPMLAAISKGEKDRWHVDLALAAVIQLLGSGIQPHHIEVIQSCTKTDANVWHSYRREGKGCGSNWAWVRASPR